MYKQKYCNCINCYQNFEQHILQRRDFKIKLDNTKHKIQNKSLFYYQFGFA